jgi:hypothetical protein
MEDAWGFEFVIKDVSGNLIISREVSFPYPIDAEKLDLRIAEIFLLFQREKEAADKKVIM